MPLVQSFFEFVDKATEPSSNYVPPKPLIDAPFDILTNIKYGEDSVCLADLYIPLISGEWEQLTPVIYIHGGGFFAGDKKGRRSLSMYFASNGYFVMTINYGLAPTYTFPSAPLHCIQAINWLSEFAPQYHLDLSKLVLAGDSAGAYLAALTSGLANNLNLSKRLCVSPKAKVNATILNCGLFEFPMIGSRKFPFDADVATYELVTGFKIKYVDAYPYKDIISPINTVNTDFPSTFIISSKKDFFCAGQAEKLTLKLLSNGINFNNFMATDIFNNHCFSLNWHNKKGQQANNEMLKFLSRL